MGNKVTLADDEAAKATESKSSKHPGASEVSATPNSAKAVPKNAKLRVQIMSDVHIEFRENERKYEFPVAAPYLALLGDIGLVSKSAFETFVLDASSKYKAVFLIAGNHEFYHSSIERTKEHLNEICSKVDNLHFMDRKSLLVEGVRVLGCTLWTSTPEHAVKDATRMCSDHKVIKLTKAKDSPVFSVADKEALHKGDVEWLAGELKAAGEAKERVLVLTHHSPTLHGVSAKSETILDDLGIHSTNLHALMGPPLHTWAFGHTHWNADQMIAGTRVVTNQRGYPAEHIQKEAAYVPFDPEFVVGV